MGLPDTVDYKYIIRKRGHECVARLKDRQRPIGIEIGVYRAALGACLLNEIPGLKWFMVDPWKQAHPDSDYYASGDSVSRLTQDQMDEVYQDAIDRVKPFVERAKIIRSQSAAARNHPDVCAYGPFDMVFLDGDHSRHGVRVDLSIWHDSVKADGWLGGHDWRPPEKADGYDVGPYVIEWFEENYGFMPPVTLGRDRTFWIKAEDYLGKQA